VIFSVFFGVIFSGVIFTGVIFSGVIFSGDVFSYIQFLVLVTDEIVLLCSVCFLIFC